MPLWRHFKPKYDGKLRESSKIKIMVSYCSSPTRKRKFQKKLKKLKKCHYGDISSENKMEKFEKDRK